MLLFVLSLGCATAPEEPTERPERPERPEQCTTGDACDDGDACTEEDTCEAGTCAGAPVTCEAPPGPTCVDGSTLRTTLDDGACSDGACVYTEVDTTCEHGCVESACAVVTGRLDWLTTLDPSAAGTATIVGMPDGDLVVSVKVPTSIVIGETTVDAGPNGYVLVRLLPDGTVRWARALSTAAETLTLGAGPDGSLFIGGQHTSTLRLAPDTDAELTLVAGRDYHGFLARLDAEGTPEWAVETAATGFAGIDSVAGTADGGVVAWGYYSGNLTLGEGEPGETQLTSTVDDFRGYLARYAPDGTLDWVWTTDGTDSRGRVAVSGDTIVVLGSFVDDIAFDNGDRYVGTGWTDAFLAAFDGAGDVAWTEGISNSWLTIEGVAVTSDGSVVAAGAFGYRSPGELTVSMGTPEETRIELVGETNAWLGRWDAGGTLAWVASAVAADGGAQFDALAPTADGGVQVVGIGVGAVTVAHSGGQAELAELSSTFGDADILFARFDAEGAFVHGSTGGGDRDDSGEGVAWGASGPVAVGTFAGEATFAPGEAGEVTVTASGAKALAIVGLKL